MIRDNRLHHSFPSCKQGHWILAVCWGCGLFSGFCLSFSAADLPVSVMHGLFYPSVSIVPLLHTILFPFLLSAFAVTFSIRALIPVLCFGKAFLFSYTLLWFHRAFGATGWLIGAVFLFSNWASVPVLYWYWHCALALRPFRKWRCSGVALALLVGIAYVDYRIISPIGARLIDF